MLSFESKITEKILSYYFFNPKAKRYSQELAKMFSFDPKNVHRKLLELEKVGLLKSEYRGRERYFWLNKNHPLLKSYKEIFSKTVGLEKRLEKIAKKTKSLKKFYIYGSYAKDRMDSSSDIDLLAVGDHSVLSLQKEINLLQKETGREFNVINLSEKEFRERQKKKDPFLKEIFIQKIIRIL